MFSFDYIGARISAFGRYERDELGALIQFLQDHGRLKGCCLDIGANIGNHAVFFADHFTHVHAFEPSPRPYSLLALNAATRDNITCYPFGLSDHSRAASLIAPQFNIGRGSIDMNISDTDLRLASEVKLMPLDSVACMDKLDVGLVKIDVEGHESNVIDGACSTLRRSGPVVVFEQQAEEIVSGTSRTIERLREMGYREFYFLSRSPQTGWAFGNLLLGLLMGQRCRFKLVTKFHRRYYAMIVAVR